MTTTRRRRFPLPVKIAAIIALTLGVIAAPWITAAAANATESPVCYGEPIPGTPEIPGTPAIPAVPEIPAVPGVPAQEAVYEWQVTVPAVEREFYVEHEYRKEVKGDVQVKGKHGWVRHNAFGWQDYPSTQWSKTDVPFLSSGPHSTFLEQWEDKGKEYRKVTTEYRYKATGKTREVTTREAVAEVRELVLVKPAVPAVPGTPAVPGSPEVPAVPAVPATPETPVVIDCPLPDPDPTDPPTEEPTSPPTTTPTTPVIVPPAPVATPPATSTPSPSLPTPTPALPGSPLSPSPTVSTPVSVPQTSASPRYTRSIPAPTSNRPELAETGAGHWVGWLSLAGAMVFLGIVTVMGTREIVRRRAL